MPCSSAPSASFVAVSWAERDGCVIAALSGELDVASAPALREELLGLLRPGASRLVVDLSSVGYADASGVAVLVGTGRRCGLLGGWLRLASPGPEVVSALAATGVDQNLAIFPTVAAAIAGRLPDTGADQARIGILGRTAPIAATIPAPYAVGDNELRAVVSALLANADAWRDADPRRRFVPAFRALARAHVGTSHAALSQAAHSFLAVLGRESLTPSPEVAVTASALRRLLHPDKRNPSGLAGRIAGPATSAGTGSLS